jgi:hypothetical protein
MRKFDREELEESFQLFERAAAKGNEESIWICKRVVKDVYMGVIAWKKAFVKSEEPLGWYFAEESFHLEGFGLIFSRRVRREDVAGDKWGTRGILNMDVILWRRTTKFLWSGWKKLRIKTIRRRWSGWDSGFERKERIRRR